MSSEIKIEKGVPMPMRRGKRFCIAPLLRQMEVGDSVLIPEGATTKNSIMAVCSRAGSFGNVKFTVRAEAGGHRIWRTK